METKKAEPGEALRVGVTWRDVTRVLLSQGYVRDRARGSHAQYKRGRSRVTVVENHPSRRVAPCLVRRINEQMAAPVQLEGKTCYLESRDNPEIF